MGCARLIYFPYFPLLSSIFSQVRAQSIEDKPELNIFPPHFLLFAFSIDMLPINHTFCFYPRQALKLDLKLDFLIFVKDILIEIFERRPFPYIVCVDVTLMRSWKLTKTWPINFRKTALLPVSVKLPAGFELIILLDGQLILQTLFFWREIH